MMNHATLASLILAAMLICASPSHAKESRAPFEMPELKPPSFPNRTFDVADYGAVPDGRTKNTEAFTAAVEACSDAGGGRVLVPAGKWLTGPIHLRSRVDLHLDKDAVIVFSPDFEDYLPPVLTRWEGMECYAYSPLIYARDCTDIAITGKGSLDGNGDAWAPLRSRKGQARDRLLEMIAEETPVAQRVFDTEEHPIRPSFIQPVNCRNVLIEGLKISSGPMWTVHIIYSENVIVRGLDVRTHGPNTDGLAVDSSRSVLAEDCSFDTGDDCIVIKSGRDEDGRRVNKPSENIIVRRCRTARGHGGVVIGSEMSGGVRNVYVHDCRFDGTDTGIRMKTRMGRGGVVERVWFSDITMGNIAGDAVKINMYYGSGPEPRDTSIAPIFKNIHISNVSCSHAARAVAVDGHSESPIVGLTMHGLSIECDDGLYCRNLRGSALTDLHIKSEKSPLLRLADCRNVTIDKAKPVEGVMLLLVEGKTEGIVLRGAKGSGAGEAFQLGDGVKPDAVRVAP